MRTFRPSHATLLMGALALAVSAGGCVAHLPHHAKHKHRHGHHHGDRHHSSGDVELVFDPLIGIYVVTGHTDHYFDDGFYYRLHKGAWNRAAHIHGPWVVVTVEEIPHRLGERHARHHGHGRGRGHGHGHGHGGD